MRLITCVLGCVAILVSSAAANAADAPRAYLVRDDFGAEPLYDCYLSYYYYVPCPTSSWFWGASGYEQGDIIGAWFDVGDPSTGGGATCDPSTCFSLDRFRFLEFAGYANYPSLEPMFAVDFDIYCADEYGCPVGPALWHSSTVRSTPGWTYVDLDPPLSFCSCGTQPGSGARVLIAVTHVGELAGICCEWGVDNVGTPAARGCTMHDAGCLPALYPRPANSNYATMHSGYYGNGAFQYCPPQWIPDGANTEGAEPYGYAELAFRIYVGCAGPSDVQPVTWGKIRTMYR